MQFQDLMVTMVYWRLSLLTHSKRMKDFKMIECEKCGLELEPNEFSGEELIGFCDECEDFTIVGKKN